MKRAQAKKLSGYADLTKRLEAVGPIVTEAEVAASVAREVRSRLTIDAAQRVVDRGWERLNALRDEAYAQPHEICAAQVRYYADRLFLLQRALNDFRRGLVLVARPRPSIAKAIAR